MPYRVSDLSQWTYLLSSLTLRIWLGFAISGKQGMETLLFLCTVYRMPSAGISHESEYLPGLVLEKVHCLAHGAICKELESVQLLMTSSLTYFKFSV